MSEYFPPPDVVVESQAKRPRGDDTTHRPRVVSLNEFLEVCR